MEEVEKKIKKVLEKERNVIFAYIFGSFARGEKDYSDIDLAIWVRKVPKNVFKYESRIAGRLEKELKRQVEVRILNNLPLLLKSRIVKEGRLVFSRDKIFSAKFEGMTISEYLDFSYLMEEYNRIRAKRYGI